MGNEQKDKEELDHNLLILSTNADGIAWTVCEEIPTKTVHVSGPNILKPIWYMINREKHQIRDISEHHLFLLDIFLTSPDNYLPLLYREIALFTSKFWKIIKYQCSVLGTIYSPLL